MINKYVARAIDPGAFADWADARDPRAAGEQARRQADAYEAAERVLAVLPVQMSSAGEDVCVYCSNEFEDEYDRETTSQGDMHESCYIDWRDSNV